MTTKEQAYAILIKMSVDNPLRKEYVEILGYDPNDKWAGPTGGFDKESYPPKE